MLFNYLKIGCRNLLKNKGFSAINITGLAIGMASAILIFLWIYDEVTYEQFHEKKDRIYEAWTWPASAASCTPGIQHPKCWRLPSRKTCLK